MVSIFRKGSLGVLTLGCLIVIPATAFGQQVGMLQDERAVTACSPGYLDYRNGTGVYYQNAPPAPAPINFNYSYSGGYPDNASVSQAAHADFGRLSVATSGSAQGGGGNGAFTWSSTYIGGDVVVGFYDVITPNEDMTLQFNYTVKCQSSFQANSGGGTYANVTTNYYFSSLSGNADFALNGTQLYTGTLQLYTGTHYQLFAGLGWDCDANAADGNPNPASFSLSATGNVQLLSLTPGATFTSASGYQYAAVPEPSPLWALGLGTLGLLRRKRR